MKIFSFDGKSIKSFAQAMNDAYFATMDEAGDYLNATVVAGMSALRALVTVPWLNRAVDIRASRVSSMPYALMRGDDDVTDEPEYASFMSDMRYLLYMVELSKVLLGAGYLYIDANASGRNVTLRFIRKQFITPHVVNGVLVEFWSSLMDNSVPRTIPLDRMVYFWNPNMTSDTEPGPGQAQVALGPASALYAISAYVAAFFNGGGVKVTLFGIPPQTPDAERDRFQSWLNRAVSNVRNAFKNIVVRNSITPTVIGSDVKETQAPELTASARQDVSVGIGVPPPIIDGLHQNKATADAVLLSFYTDTIIPEFNRLAAVLNKQLLSRWGLKLVGKPELLEVMQDAQLVKAQAVQVLVGKPVLTLDEGRALLGYDPIEEEDAEELDTPATTPAPREAEPPEEETETPEEEAPDKENAGEQFDKLIKALSTWRTRALASVGQPVGAWFDDELITCKTKSDVRAVFERAWPHKARAQEPSASDVLAELRAARLAAERLRA